MPKVLVFGTLLGVAVPRAAVAQPPPPPPPSGGVVLPAASAPQMRFDVGLGAGIASGDFENVDTSPALTLIFGATVAPNISVFGGLRYIAISADDGPGDAAQYDLLGGGRYAFPISPTAIGFGEGFLTYSTLSIDLGDEMFSESGLGIGLRGGVMFTVSGNTSIGGALGFTTASIEDGDAAWVTPEVFVSFGF